MRSHLLRASLLCDSLGAVWKRRFIEVDRGELRLFHTDTPENFTLPPREVPMSCTLHMAPTGSSVELRSEDGSTAFHVRASDTVVHDLAQRVLTLRMGDGVQAVGNAINTVVVLPAGREAVLTLLGDVFTTCVKTPKGTLKLEGITIDTSEHQVGQVFFSQPLVSHLTPL